MTAQQIVAGMPDSPQAIEDYVMGLGNRRVEILARRFFRVQILPYLFPDRYVPVIGLTWEEALAIYKEEFLKALADQWWAKI